MPCDDLLRRGLNHSSLMKTYRVKAQRIVRIKHYIINPAVIDLHLIVGRSLVPLTSGKGNVPIVPKVCYFVSAFAFDSRKSAVSG